MTTNVTPPIQSIPLSRLRPSEANVRRTGREQGIEELAASIAAHGLLQNLTVRPAEGGREGAFEVIAGGRRLAALRMLAKRKVIAKGFAVPCAVAEGVAEEVSLAENVTQCPMHPADQYEAFARLHAGQGLPVEDIAARFGVTPAVVRQRMKLAAVSPALMQVYRDGGMSLEQLMAFAITDDHARQERVWAELGYNRSRQAIRQMLMDGHVLSGDRRVRFIGVEAYEAAGGGIVRDLFDEESGGYLTDVELIERLVREKLDAIADEVRAEGWKWVTVVPEFNYQTAAGLRRVYPEPVALDDAQQARLEQLEREYEQLGHEDAEDTAERLEALEADIAALTGMERYAGADIALGGAFVSLGYDGVRVERGFIRPEDEPGQGEEAAPDEAGAAEPVGGDAKEAEGPLSERLVAELTAHRTAALRQALATQPELALVAVVHALAARMFYRHGDATCLEVEARSSHLGGHAPGIDEGAAMRALDEAHVAWARRLPEHAGQLWAFVRQMPEGERMALLAHCAALTVNGVRVAGMRPSPRLKHAEMLAEAARLDMAAHWAPTVVGYFGRVTKARIIEAVREAKGDEAAAGLDGLTKTVMAERGEALMAGSGWVPPLLRTAYVGDGAAA